MSARDGPCSSRLSLSPNSPASRSYRPGRRSSRSPRSPYRSPPYPRSNPPPSRSSRDSSSGRELGPDGSTISSRRPKKPPPPPPDRPGGAYDDPPPPPAPPANSASESLTPLAFFSFFVSFTVAAAPSVGNADASSSFAASPRDGNAAFAAGASSFASSVCTDPAKTHTHITPRQSFIVAFPRESAEDALALRPRRLRPHRPHRISNRPHRPLRALSARAPSIDRSIDPTHFPSSHSRVIPRVPSLLASLARRSSRSSMARGAAEASSREIRARRWTRARPTTAIDIARDGRGDIFRIARTRSLHAAAFPHAMVESCACDARLALGL